MMGYKNPNDVGKYPITKIQFESAMKLCAQLAKKYSIPIYSPYVVTHHEFGMAHQHTTSYGKIDITFIPPYPWVDKESTGNFIRSKIRWYFEHLED